ncbi:MAG: FKBP-type peptidyl-prolyl cis-trans isomerase [Pseudomonadales bacterium]|nr:FKBP-type peptidyl-prolyl cis-trans isomerase [Pseudomonadales bacterium]
MKKFLNAFIAISTVALIGCQDQSNESSTLETHDQKLAYAVGIQFGSRLKKDFQTLDLDAFTQGFKHSFRDIEPMLSEEEMINAFTQYKQKRLAEDAARQSISPNKNIAQGEAFLAENGKKDGVTTLSSDVQYSVITSGAPDGISPLATDVVSVHYRGSLIDGTEFDSSYTRGEPAKFPLNRVIPGWTEILQLMKPGDKWQVFIPSKSAYGSDGAGGKIGPGATLIFDIELIEVLK